MDATIKLDKESSWAQSKAPLGVRNIQIVQGFHRPTETI